MNGKGQQDYATIIFGLFGLLCVIIFVGMLINGLYCIDEKAKIHELNSKINSLEISLQKAVEDANFFRVQYETLRDQNITKQDFVDLKAQVGDLNYYITQINSQLTTINQQIQYRYDVFSLSIGLNFVLLPLSLFTLFDIAFLNFRFTKKIRVAIVSINSKIKAVIKGRQRDSE